MIQAGAEINPAALFDELRNSTNWSSSQFNGPGYVRKCTWEFVLFQNPDSLDGVPTLKDALAAVRVDGEPVLFNHVQLTMYDYKTEPPVINIRLSYKTTNITAPGMCAEELWYSMYLSRERLTL